MVPDWMPMRAFDPAAKIATARGYTGQSVSATNLTKALKSCPADAA